MNIREKSYHTNYTIKYLHSVTRFLIIDVTLFLFFMKSSLKSHKSTSKSEMIRVYCDIARDNKRNKLWKNQKVKIVVEKSCFLQILDKKTKNDLLIMNSKNLKNSKYHYADSYEFRIAQTDVWFIERITTSKQRRRVAIEHVKLHRQWKIKATENYHKDCRIYIQKRIKWEWELLNYVLHYSNLKWSSIATSKRILILTQSFKIRLHDDYTRMIKQKNDSE
jgi:hypothetical protein